MYDLYNYFINDKGNGSIIILKADMMKKNSDRLTKLGDLVANSMI